MLLCFTAYNFERCNYLHAQLNVANDTLVELNERVQLQEFEHEDIVRQRDEIIAVLKVSNHDAFDHPRVFFGAVLEDFS